MLVAARVFLVAALSVAACSRPAGPSPEHARAMARYEAVLAETLDPSYAHPAYAEVESLLRAVPASAPEHGPAVALAGEIAAARAKRAELLAGLEAMKTAPVLAPTEEEVPAAAAAAAPAPDAPSPATAAPAPDAPSPATAAAPAPEPTRPPAAERRPTPSGPVVIYTTAWCGVCKRAKAYLSQTNIRFVEKDVEEDEAAGAEYAAKRQQNNLRNGVPLIDVDGLYMVGFGPQQLNKMLLAKGYL